MPSARSRPAGLPSCSSVAVRSSTSSTIWKTIPRCVPYAVSASTGRPVEAADDGADAAGGGHQGGRLALDGAEVRGLVAVDVVEALQLQDLALAQLGDGGGQEAGHFHPQRGGQGRRPGQEEVAGQDGHDVRPAGVDALHAPPGGRLVDHVIVVEGPEVDELHSHCPGDDVVGRRPAAAGIAGAEGQGGGSACRRPRSGALRPR